MEVFGESEVLGPFISDINSPFNILIGLDAHFIVYDIEVPTG